MRAFILMPLAMLPLSLRAAAYGLRCAFVTPHYLRHVATLMMLPLPLLSPPMLPPPPLRFCCHAAAAARFSPFLRMRPRRHYFLHASLMPRCC